MRRLLFLALLAVGLLAQPGAVRAQATADQLNRLSLEALTARPAGGGYSRRGERARYQPRYHGSRRHAYAPRAYARAPHRRFVAPAARGYRNHPVYRRAGPAHNRRRTR